MSFLTRPAGRFPIGIWIVVVLFFLSGFIFTLFGQGLSVLSWDTALALGLQEDSRTSPDIVERSIGAMSQGEAGADFLVQGALFLLTIIGIFRRKFYGYVAGMAQGVLWIYVTFMVIFQRLTFYTWGLVPDLSRAEYVAPIMFLAAMVPGIFTLYVLEKNRSWFTEGNREI